MPQFLQISNLRRNSLNLVICYTRREKVKLDWIRFFFFVKLNWLYLVVQNLPIFSHFKSDRFLMPFGISWIQLPYKFKWLRLGHARKRESGKKSMRLWARFKWVNFGVNLGMLRIVVLVIFSSINSSLSSNSILLLSFFFFFWKWNRKWNENDKNIKQIHNVEVTFCCHHDSVKLREIYHFSYSIKLSLKVDITNFFFTRHFISRLWKNYCHVKFLR